MSTKLNLVICVIAVVLAFMLRIQLPGLMIMFAMPMLLIAGIVNIKVANSYRNNAKLLKLPTALIAILANLSIIMFALLSVDGANSSGGMSVGGQTIVWRAIFTPQNVQIINKYVVPDDSGLFYVVAIPIVVFIACQSLLINRLKSNRQRPSTNKAS